MAGVILAIYLTLHLSNHALGLISRGAMDAGRVWFLALWRNPLGTAMLYSAFLTHLVLALMAIYERRTLRVPFWELLRLTLGLSIPLLVASHVVGTRVSNAWFGAQDSRMGYGEAMYLTAVGDTVHVASRLQDLTKEYDCQLVVSEDVAAVAGIDASPFPRHEIHVRNRERPLAIRVIDDVHRIAVA